LNPLKSLSTGSTFSTFSTFSNGRPGGAGDRCRMLYFSSQVAVTLPIHAQIALCVAFGVPAEGGWQQDGRETHFGASAREHRRYVFRGFGCQGVVSRRYVPLECGLRFSGNLLRTRVGRTSGRPRPDSRNLGKRSVCACGLTLQRESHDHPAAILPQRARQMLHTKRFEHGLARQQLPHSRNRASGYSH